MQIKASEIRYLPATILIVLGVLVCAYVATADMYTDTAHGNATYGVDRENHTECPAGTTCEPGDCTHCHDPFDPSICGVNTLMLFSANDAEFCLDCHDNTTSPSDRAVANRSYMYRAGGWTDDTVDDIREAFDSASKHNLNDVETFINGKWGYNAESNPCTACHNQHLVQGDPEHAPDAVKTDSTRGWLVSRPSDHDGGVWELWGDDATERMNAYTSDYQAPYRYDSTATYEPDGSGTIDGSNLTDFNTFCTDCHNTTYTIYSTSLGRNLRQIDWDVEKHGKGDADGALDEMRDPYTVTTDPLFGFYPNRVLSCLDCHEPHGSPNAYLLRDELNGELLDDAVTSFDTGICLPKPESPGNKDIGWLCGKCHKDDSNYGYGANEWKFLHHYPNYTSDAPYKRTRCYRCHVSPSPGDEPVACGCCHYHGSQTTDYGVDYPCYVDEYVCNEPYDRRTF